MSDISVQELKKRLDSGEDILVIDVRESWEYDEFNINAKLMPLGELQGSLNDLKDHMNDEIIVHCKSGGRSAAACDYLTKQGFTNVRNLSGGMMAWQNM
jgi:rhodanese-related sulfurtransferase